MPEYTYADVIIDPNDPRVEVWKEYYVGSTPTEALLNAQRGAETALLRVVDKEFMSPFFMNASSDGFACLIRKKGEEKHYVPFDLSKEEDRAMLRGAWVRIKNIPTTEYQIIGLNSIYAFLSNGEGQAMIALLGAFEFLDGSLCGRLVEEE